MFSFIMGTALLITSGLMINLYAKYCDYVNHQDPPDHDQHIDDYSGNNCEEDENNFIVLPLFGFLTMAAWVRARQIMHTLS